MDLLFQGFYDEQLVDLCREFGQVVSAKVMLDPQNNASLGFGYAYACMSASESEKHKHICFSISHTVLCI